MNNNQLLIKAYGITINTMETLNHTHLPLYKKTVEKRNELLKQEEKNQNCGCDYTEGTFYQNHGCCEWCYYIGE